jgi:phage terminase large subunit-like protein
MASTQELLGIYSKSDNPFVRFVTTTDLVAKQAAFQDIRRSMSAPGLGGYKTEFEAFQDMMRKSKLSKSTTPLGVVGLDELAAMDKVFAASIASQLDPLSYLATYNTSLQGKAKPQPDMTTQYTKQVQSSLQLKDLNDARQGYTDAYFKAFGQFPAAELDKKFQDAWNAEAKKQLQPTTTDTKTEKGYRYDTKSKPVMDKATGKQKVDSIGQKVYSKILTKDGVKLTNNKVTSPTTAMGQGFTAEEQTNFLADFLVSNFPEAQWNVDDIGGTAKTIYDTITSYHKGNYDAEPDFATVSPFIKNILSNPDEEVQKEMFNQYVGDLQKKSSMRFMSIQGLLQPGENANKYIDPVLKSIGNALERTIDIKDPLAIKVLNFKDEKGNHRLPNDFELNDLVVNDTRYDGTSTAINTAVNMAQTLRNALR